VSIQIFNPLSSTRWDEFVAEHPKASAFHQRGWLEALRQTYGYEPMVLTSTAGDRPLSNGIVFCQVSSWITGTRLVSLPFADHCEPLLENNDQFEEFAAWLRAEADRRHWKYVELRPLVGAKAGTVSFGRSATYCFHELNLRPSLAQIFQRLHKDSIQRRIRRAERAGLTYKAGNSEDLLGQFYHLMVMTRRRHRLLPQPRSWFRNLASSMGDKLLIRVVCQASTPIAAVLSLGHRSSFIYKYGCSNEKFHKFGGMPYLFWKLIEESKVAGGEMLDFGRSDLDQGSLINFKDKLGTAKRQLSYYRYVSEKQPHTAQTRWIPASLTQLFSTLPDSVCSTAGQLLYRHMG
jgi:hypothetical protein